MKYKVRITAVVEAASFLDACIKTSLVPGFYFSELNDARATKIVIGTYQPDKEFLQKHVEVENHQTNTRPKPLPLRH
jgi:hypothetical protein